MSAGGVTPRLVIDGQQRITTATLLVIALAWIFYRPLIGILLLAVVGAVIFAFSSKGKKLIAEKMKRS